MINGTESKLLTEIEAIFEQNVYTDALPEESRSTLTPSDIERLREISSRPLPSFHVPSIDEFISLCTATPVPVPMPQCFTACQTSSSAISLSWRRIMLLPISSVAYHVVMHRGDANDSGCCSNCDGEYEPKEVYCGKEWSCIVEYLESDTNYTFYLRATCGSSNTSNWSQPVCVKTKTFAQKNSQQELIPGKKSIYRGIQLFQSQERL